MPVRKLSLDSALSADAREALDAIATQTGQTVPALVEMLIGFWEPHLIDAACTLRQLGQIKADFQAVVDRQAEAIDHFGVGAQMDGFINGTVDALMRLERARLAHNSPLAVEIAPSQPRMAKSVAGRISAR